MNKTKAFNDKIINTSSKISKSSLRRRKRKEREALKPKMEELLDTLPEVDTNTEYVEAKPSSSNQPNFRKQSGKKIIFKQEHANFNKILTNQEFRTSPFNTLKQAIQDNISSGRS